MGCKQSLPLDHSRMFLAKNVNEKQRSCRNVILEVKDQRLFVYSRRVRKQLASWPILALKKYGCNKDCLVIETNSACDNGAGTYIFKCPCADNIFKLVAEVWQEIHEKRFQLIHQQNQINNVLFNPALFRQQQQQQMCAQTSRQHNYYNTNNSSASYNTGNGNVITPRSNGSIPVRSISSSKGNLPLLEGDSGLNSSQRSVLGPTFELQPAPTSREEMLHRRRINSGVTFCRESESVFMGYTRPRHRSAMPEADYQNSQIIRQHDLGLSPVMYDCSAQDVIMERSSPDSEHQPTTPGSNGTSGISSLNGNSTTSETKSQTQCSIDDPWRPKQPSISRSSSAKKPRNKLILRSDFLNMPMSAREYLNAANARMDVSGTPIPATAMVGNGGTHFSFDFDHTFPVSSSCGNSHRNINYVPIEVSMKNGDFYSCGTSSASSGLGPATPLTPPPKTPNGHSNTTYAIIDPHKTRALSDAHKHRQRERKSCRKNSETRPMLTNVS